MGLEQLHLWHRRRQRAAQPGPLPEARTPDPSSPPRGSAPTPVLRRIWRSTRGQWRRCALLVLGLWSAYALVFSSHGVLHLSALRREATALEAEQERLLATRDSLALVLAAAEDDALPLLERRAREAFGFSRENERIYLVPEDPADDRCVGAGLLHGGETFRDREAAGAAGKPVDSPRAGS